MNFKLFVFIALVFSASVGFYNVISSFLELQAAEREVQSAESELLKTTQAELDARERLDNLKMYGCAEPTAGPGFVSCP